LKGSVVLNFYGIIGAILLSALFIGLAVGIRAGLASGILAFIGVVLMLLSVFFMIARIDMTIFNVLMSLLHPGTPI
jgi:hypothetical protein